MLDTLPDPVYVVHGATSKIHIHVTRGADVKGPVTVSSVGFRDGISIPPVVLGPDDSADLLADVTGAASQGLAKGAITLTASDAPPASSLATLFVMAVNGEADTTFGNGGVSTRAFTSPAILQQVLAAPDGTFYVIAATSQFSSGVTRVSHLLFDGSADAAYGSGGVAEIALSAPSRGVLQKDGKLLIVGADLASTSNLGWVVRLDNKGAADSTFGDQSQGPGTVKFGTAGLPGNNRGNRGVAVRDSDGAIFVMFDILNPPINQQAGVMRLDANGAVHTAFGSGGADAFLTGDPTTIAVRNLPGSPSKDSVFLMAENNAPGTYGVLQRTGDDAADPAFGSNEKDSPVPDNNASRVVTWDLGHVELADGSLIALVNTFAGNFYLRKFSAGGDLPLDPFGTSGLVGPMGYSFADGLIAQTDGKPLVWFRQAGSLTGIVIFRFLPTGAGNPLGPPGTTFRVAADANVTVPSSVAVSKEGRIVLAYTTTAGITTLNSYWP